MSGGYFNYEQYHGDHIADEIQRLIETNDDTSIDECGYIRGRHYNEETIVRFQEAVTFLRLGALYAQRIDWLVSGDDGEESFHERLSAELKRLQCDQTG